MTEEQVARILLVTSLAAYVTRWVEGDLTGDQAMSDVHEALLTYREAL